MQLGAWKSYDELEENLTTEELFELYRGIMDTRFEEFKNVARANGAKFDEGDKDPEAFNRVVEEVRKRKGEQIQGGTEKREPKLGLFSIKQI